MKDAFFVSGSGDIESLALFQQGAFLVQDPAARLAVLAAGLQPGMCVLDGCAAPGGKSFAAAMLMENTGHIISCDIHPHKVQLLQKGAHRLGIKILEARLQDARENITDYVDSMDVVIADVPCSGLGVIRKKPDIRYNDISRMENLPEIQGEILNNLSTYVRPGGVLLYSTCTVLKRENEQIVTAFIQAHPDFALEPFDAPIPSESTNDGMLTLLPSIHDTDGFFICKMRRTE